MLLYITITLLITFFNLGLLSFSFGDQIYILIHKQTTKNAKKDI